MFKEDIITGNCFKNIADDFIDESKTYIDLSKKPKIIFCYTDWLMLFIKKVLPNIDYNFKLITHNADKSINSDFISLLEDVRLTQWFGMNCHIKHRKLFPIPIGIANEKWPHGNKDLLLKEINNKIKKENFVYSNFDVSTNFLERNKIYKIVENKKFITNEKHKLEFHQYLKTLNTYKFVISPPGNSVDCHRIWEAIYLGVIPIVEEHLALKTFEDLPILYVDSFENLNEQHLNNCYYEIYNKQKKQSLFHFYKEIIINT